MNHKKRLHEIYDFLKSYEAIWQKEIMLLYPDPLVDYPAEWIEDLARIRDKESIIRLEKKDVGGLLKDPELIAFHKRIDELSELDQRPDAPPLPVDFKTFLYMIPKKQHEVTHLAPIVNKVYKEIQAVKVVDIGGGIGILAQTLNRTYGLKVQSLDLDPVMQKTGDDRQRKESPEGQKVEYHNVTVDAGDITFNRLLDHKTITLGLHTCGDLANHQLRASVRNKVPAIINFGCCYHKLEGIEGSENISEEAQNLEAPLEMSHFALTLSARAHRKMDDKDYDLKMKVKLYRYAIHMLLHDEYGFRKLVTLGNSNPKLYDESFGTYVQEQFRRVNITAKHSKDALDAWFMNGERQELIWKMLAAGLIRNWLGRLLELYILLDRVCYLEENGYDAKILEFFDESTSPRNIGILARLKA